MRDAPAARSPALTVLAFLFAVGLLVEWSPVLAPLHAPGLPTSRPLWHGTLLVCGAAILVLLRPSSTPRLLVLAACGVYNALGLMPGINNHNLFTLFVDSTLLGSALFALLAGWRAGGLRVPRRDLYRAAAPVLRAQLLVLYFWAFFHKLNRDFLDPEVSCGGAQLVQLSGTLPFVPSEGWALSFAVYGTLAVELAIPLLLAIRRTRVPGLLLGIGFHSMLAFHYPGFSALVFAFYCVFVPERVFEALASERREPPGEGLLPASGAGRVFVEGCLFVAIAAGVAAFQAAPSIAGLPKSGLTAIWGLALGAVFALRVARRPEMRAGEVHLFRGPAPALLVLPLVLFVNGATPHLGIKNVQAFAMFSNLRTGGGDSNHLLLPSALQLSDNLRDLARIRASNDPVLGQLVEPRRSSSFALLVPYPWQETPEAPRFQFALPYLALRTRVSHLAASGVGNVHVAFERGESRRLAENAERDAELAGVPWLVRKFVRLRAVPISPRAPCMW